MIEVGSDLPTAEITDSTSGFGAIEKEQPMKTPYIPAGK